MKVVIAGSRSIQKQEDVDYAMSFCPFEITEVVSGGATGVDTLGENWAKANNIPVKVFPAQWDLHGKAAGFIRNEQMAKYADALIAIWDGKSRGTEHMIRTMSLDDTKHVFTITMDPNESTC